MPHPIEDYNRGVIADFRANQGKLGGVYADLSLLLLTTIGAKSGARRTTPLVYTKDGDRLVVVASFGGNPKHPAWFLNLRQNHEVTLELGAETFTALATIAEGGERQRLFDAHAKQVPAYAEEQKKTTRQFPVVVLERIGQTPGSRCTVGDYVMRSA
jgi:deazaflavin-dependent oxidoreductase (nitroreductase family)